MTTTTTPRIGVRFEPGWPPEDLPEFARWAEDAGYDELWFSEDLPWAGGIAMAATALAVTSHISVGIGLLPAVTRNVATAAMDIAALARISPGRVIIALGNGIPSWMVEIGASVPRPLVALEETAVALRRLLAGETVTVDGSHVHLEHVTLGFPPLVPPKIFLGTTGPVGLRVTGRSSDGVLLPELASPDAVRWARAEMASAGGDGETLVLAMSSIGDDRTQALAELRPRVQGLVDLRFFDKLAEVAGLGADGSGPLTDEILQSVAIGGTPADAARTVAAWTDAGVSRIIIVSGADDPKATYRRFAAEVFPLIGR